LLLGPGTGKSARSGKRTKSAASTPSALKEGVANLTLKTIRIVEQSHLPAMIILDKLCIARPTF
jgi:hypothetical protein